MYCIVVTGKAISTKVIHEHCLDVSIPKIEQHLYSGVKIFETLLDTLGNYGA